MFAIVLCYKIGGQNIRDCFPKVMFPSISLLFHQELEPPSVPVTVQDLLYFLFLFVNDDQWGGGGSCSPFPGIGFSRVVESFTMLNTG